MVNMVMIYEKRWKKNGEKNGNETLTMVKNHEKKVK
jgi:hypothetical protein